MASGHRALWKGFLKFGEVSCGVALYTAASTSERITFNSINKVTGNRVNRVFIDSETEERVEREDQTKGFEIENGHYIVIDPEEVAATEPGRRETRSQPRSTGSDRFCFLKRRTIVENRKPFRDLLLAIQVARGNVVGSDTFQAHEPTGLSESWNRIKKLSFAGLRPFFEPQEGAGFPS